MTEEILKEQSIVDILALLYLSYSLIFFIVWYLYVSSFPTVTLCSEKIDSLEIVQ